MQNTCCNDQQATNVIMVTLKNGLKTWASPWECKWPHDDLMSFAHYKVSVACVTCHKCFHKCSQQSLDCCGRPVWEERERSCCYVRKTHSRWMRSHWSVLSPPCWFNYCNPKDYLHSAGGSNRIKPYQRISKITPMQKCLFLYICILSTLRLDENFWSLCRVWLTI